MYKFAYYLSSRKRRTTQEGSHHSKKQKKCVPTRDDDAALNRASSSANKSCKRSSQKVSSKEQRGLTPTAMGPHFSLRPHTGAKGSHDGMLQKSSSCNEEASSAASKQHEEESGHIEANKQRGGMSRLPAEMRTFCGKRRWGRPCNPVQMGCYSPGTEPDHVPYHLYKLVKEAADIVTRFKRSENTNDLRDLRSVEEKIRFFCIYFNCHLPRGWEYKRDNASSLIAGCDTHFAKDGPRYDLSGYTPFRDKPRIAYTADIMRIIHSRKTPTPETFNEWIWPRMSFYCQLCSCFGIDYQNLETASEDDVCLMNVGS